MNNVWTADKLIAESNDIRKFYKKGPYRHMFYEESGKWFVRGQERKAEELEDLARGTEVLSLDQLFDSVDEGDDNDDI